MQSNPRMYEWNEHILHKLNEYYNLCKMKNFLHIKSAERYKNLYTLNTLPVIILSSTTTVLATYNSSNMGKYFSIAVATMSGLTTIWHSVNAFLEFNTRLEKHLLTANKYINLSRIIESEIYSNYYNSNIVNQNVLQNIPNQIEESLSDEHVNTNIPIMSDFDEKNNIDIQLNIDNNPYSNEYVKILFDKIQKELSNIQDIEPLIPESIQKLEYKDVHNCSLNVNKYNNILSYSIHDNNMYANIN